MKQFNVRHIIILVTLILVPLMVLQTVATNQQDVAASLDYNTTISTEHEWLRYMRNEAKSKGLVGDPSIEEYALMTYGSYLVLTGKNVNDNFLPRDNPVFVYQVLGDIPLLNGFGLGSGSTDIKGLIFVYNAVNGQPLTHSALSNLVGKLDLTTIPADPGAIRSLQSETLPTMIPEWIEETLEAVPFP